MKILFVLSLISFYIPMGIIFKFKDDNYARFQFLIKKSSDGMFPGDADFSYGNGYKLLAFFSCFVLAIFPLVGLISINVFLVILINTIIALIVPFILALIVPMDWACYYKTVEKNIVIFSIMGLVLYFIAFLMIPS